MTEVHDINVIIIGTLETDSDKNIYSPEWRKDVIEQTFPKLEVTFLTDSEDDKTWIFSLKKLLEAYDVETYNFYCGDKKNDYAIQVIEQYSKLF